MSTKNLFYTLTCISFSVILGAGIYEHVAIWPSAFSEPPRSLALFQGAYKLNAAPFWMSIHPITLILFAITLSLNWNTQRRRYVLVPLVTYVTVLVATFTFFVPTLMHITETPFAETVNRDLQELGSLWIKLSLIRAVILFGSAAMLMFGMTQSAAGREAVRAEAKVGSQVMG